MSRGRKELTIAQLAVLAQAREKAKIVIAERAELNALAKKDEAPRLGVVDYDNDERTNTNKYAYISFFDTLCGEIWHKEEACVAV